MSRTANELLAEAQTLDENERARLAGLLLESLEPAPDANVEKAWANEIERRVQQIDSGEVKLVPWEEVKARLITGNSASR